MPTTIFFSLSILFAVSILGVGNASAGEAPIKSDKHKLEQSQGPTEVTQDGANRSAKGPSYKTEPQIAKYVKAAAGKETEKLIFKFPSPCIEGEEDLVVSMRIDSKADGKKIFTYT